jgi:hypothetical protein
MRSFDFGKGKRIAEVAVQHLIERIETRELSPADEKLLQHYSFPKIRDAMALADRMQVSKGFKGAARMELSNVEVGVVREALRGEMEDVAFEQQLGHQRSHHVKQALQSLCSTFQLDFSSVDAS